MVDRHHPGRAPTAMLQALADGSCQTIDQLEPRLDLTRRQVSEAAACLLRRDYLMRMATGCFQLTDAGLAAAANGEVITSGRRGTRDKTKVLRDTLRARAWRSMRIRTRFTINDLVTDAARPTDAMPGDNLQRYLRVLKMAGYVVAEARRAPGTATTSNGFICFRLIRNTGRMAPIYRSSIGVIHDPNTGEDVPCTPR